MTDRGKNITKEQKVLLVSLLDEDIPLANHRFDSVDRKNRNREGGQRIAVKLNCLGGSTKEADKWKKAWIDMKKYVRAQWAMLKEYDNRAGLGTEVKARRANQLSSLGVRILNIFTSEAVEGSNTNEDGFLTTSMEIQNNAQVSIITTPTNVDEDEKFSQQTSRPIRTRRIRGSAFTRAKILQEANKIDREKADGLLRHACAKEQSNIIKERGLAIKQQIVLAMEERNRILREVYLNKR